MSDEATKERLQNVPDPREHPDRARAWLTLAFGADGVGEVVRYGGQSCTPMTVELVDRSGERHLVRFEEEREAAYGALRAELIRQGHVRAAHVTSGKVAADAYFLLCGLARVVGAVDPRDEAREWVDGYRVEAESSVRSFTKGDLYATLDALRSWPYSRRQVNLWLDAHETKPPPHPPLFVDRDHGHEWTSISHLATYVRWGRDQAGSISNGALAGRVVEIGGARHKVQAWDTTTRERQHKITTVLIRLPDDRG